MKISLAGSIPIKVPLCKEIKLEIDLSNNIKLFKECAKWSDSTFAENIISKVDIDRYIGLFPVEIDFMKNIVTFTADEFNHKLDWKDWFIMEDN